MPSGDFHYFLTFLPRLEPFCLSKPEQILPNPHKSFQLNFGKRVVSKRGMKISRVVNHGNERWKLDYYVGPKRVVRFFPKKHEAETEVDRIGGAVLESGEWWAALPSDRRNDIIAVVREIETAGLSMREVWDSHRLAGKPVVASVTLDDAIKALLDSRQQANRRENYIGNLGSVLRHFAKGRGQEKVDAVTTQEIESWLPEQPESRLTYINRLNTLFSFCKRRRWITENPVDGIDRPIIEQRPAQILSPESAARIALETRRNAPAMLPWLTLGLFCGLRPEEADRLEWCSVDLIAGTIRLDAAASKVRRRRIVHLMANAVEWLKVAKELEPEIPLAFSTRRKAMRSIKQAMDWKSWPKDILRHTAASNLLAHCQDAGKVAHELGNSVGVLLTHYKELVTKEQAEAFWSITP